MFVEFTHGDRTRYGGCGLAKNQREIYTEKFSVRTNSCFVCDHPVKGNSFASFHHNTTEK